MKKNKRFIFFLSAAFLVIIAIQCHSNNNGKSVIGNSNVQDSSTFILQAEDFIASSGEIPEKIVKKDAGFVKATTGGWLSYRIDVPYSGRYQVQLFAQTPDTSKVNCWLEDYIDNKDGRTFNITGNMLLQRSADNSSFLSAGKDGSPLAKGIHNIRLHFDSAAISIDKISFRLIKPHKNSPEILTQKTDGKNWKLVWSDEFDGQGLPDSTKWSFDIGNWGWGNNELQYYTYKKVENARQDGGNLIIEARKDNGGHPWSSARLTTRGKVSFLYGKIEFRGKVPVGRGTWAAGWLLGDNYVDEISWPYCGEIDVLENVGFELDGKTGNGKTHASVHCGAYYFKLGNQPTAITDVENMNNAFHEYTLEWLPSGMTIYVDGKKYFGYHDTSNDLTWPFNKAQNIILNLAIGGGWGGAKGLDPELTSQQLIIDYVRVFERP